MRQIAAAILALILGGCAVSTRAPPHTVEEPAYAVPAGRPVRLAVVLSSGAMRGFAHVGVLRELRAQGIVPDLVVGTSVGAIVGALFASGATDGEMLAAARDFGSDLLVDWTMPRLGLLPGRSIHAFIDRHAKRHRIETFPIGFAAVAVEAERACLQIFNAGDVGKATQASSTIPVVLAPPEISGQHYLDGGLASPLPARVARALGAERVIAVDVTFDPAQRGFGSILEAFWRTTLMMHWTLAVNERQDADHVIVPMLPPESRIGFGSRETLIEAGAEAVRKDLPEIRKALAVPPRAPAGTVHPVLKALLCPAP